MAKLRGKFGGRIRQLRKALQLTQDELGRRVGMEGKIVGEIERGRRNLTLDTIERILRGLKVEPFEAFLFTFADKPVGRRIDQDLLENLIKNSDEGVRPLLVGLAQTALEWAHARKSK